MIEAQTALGFFLKASYECPASVTAQGARIALSIRDTGEHPQTLMSALIDDKQRFQTVIDSALVAHRSSNRAPGKISEEKALELITAGFQTAEILSLLSPAQLEHLSGPVYQFYASQRPMIYPEDHMHEAMDRMLKGRLVEVSGKSENPPEPFVIYQV